METDDVAMGDKALEAATENKTMVEAGDDITKDNEAPDANVEAAEEETSKEKEQAEADAVMA